MHNRYKQLIKFLICTTVLSIITILLWRYLSKVALQCFIVLNVLVNVIFINYFYSDFALSKHFNQAGVTKESLHGPGLDNKDEIDAIRYIQNQDKDFYRIINQTIIIKIRRCCKVIMVQVLIKA